MKFKGFLYFVWTTIILTSIVNCGNPKQYAQKKTEKEVEKQDTIVIENDSLDYRIVIIDVGFNGWLATQQPRGYFTQRYMELKNMQYVMEYNLRVTNPMGYDQTLYPFRIDYNFETDYGYEVNYLLYHYFLFFEQKYNQKLG